jgi:hypothetical protein
VETQGCSPAAVVPNQADLLMVARSAFCSGSFVADPHRNREQMSSWKGTMPASALFSESSPTFPPKANTESTTIFVDKFHPGVLNR